MRKIWITDDPYDAISDETKAAAAAAGAPSIVCGVSPALERYVSADHRGLAEIDDDDPQDAPPTAREVYEAKLSELGGSPTTAKKVAALEAVLDILP